MKLLTALTSPYGRKVHVCALETGLDERIEIVVTGTSQPELRELNPLGKIPALVTDDGQVLFDSPVICEYLDSLHDGDPLFPPAGNLRWSALRMQALADGMLDAALLRRYELARPESLRSAEWDQHQRLAMESGLDALERQSIVFAHRPDIGLVAVACALGYLDFRFAHEPWRDSRPRLAAWYDAWRERRSMRETEPPA